MRWLKLENKFFELSRSSLEFSPILQSDLITIIEGFNWKTFPGIDNVPWKLYLENIDILVPHFETLLNLVLKTYAKWLEMRVSYSAL